MQLYMKYKAFIKQPYNELDAGISEQEMCNFWLLTLFVQSIIYLVPKC